MTEQTEERANIISTEKVCRLKAGSVNKPEKAKKFPCRARLNASPTNGKTASIIES